MIKELKKAVLTTKAVAWHEDKPTKYQSALEYQVTGKRIIRISGDPKPTQDAALESLCNERMLWEESMEAFKKVEL